MAEQIMVKSFKIITDGLYCGNQCEGLGFINGVHGVKFKYFHDWMSAWMTTGWQIRVFRCGPCKKEFGND